MIAGRLPSAGRLAAAGLAIASIVIIALAVLARVELDHEAELHREVIDGARAKDSLEKLRAQLADLGHSARLVSVTGDPVAAQLIERRAVEMEAELEYLAGHMERDDPVAVFAALRQSSHALALGARSIAPLRAARGPAAAGSAALEAERASLEAMTALERMLDSRASRINDRTLAQIRTGETLRSYVSWLVAGSVLVLMGLFATYRWATLRERDAQRRIEHLAHYDVVTSLPNRALLADRLQQEISRARRARNGFALLMFDLDGFKLVNDAWGHAAGDLVLAQVGERARQVMRASDTVGRIGGDEFMAILPEASLSGALAVGEKLLEVMARPYALDKAEARLSTSVGIAIFPEDGVDGESLQRAADDALYQAKRAGKNRVRNASESTSGEPDAPGVAGLASTPQAG
jgi:diguanylate cyclase (GGDEF)-like protein